MNYNKLILLGLSLSLSFLIGCSKGIPDPPQGKILFFVEKQGVYIVNADGTGMKKVVEGEEMEFLDEIYLSPQRDKILLVKNKEIWIMNSDGSERKKLSRGICADFSPDGGKIKFLLEEDYYIMNIDGTGIERWEDSKRRWKESIGGLISPDGKKSLDYGRKNELIVTNIDGSGEKKIQISPEDGELTGIFPSFSPDSKMIVFETLKTCYGEPGMPVEYPYFNVGIASTDGTEKRMLTNCIYPLCCSQPNFTPDSKKIVYRVTYYTKYSNGFIQFIKYIFEEILATMEITHRSELRIINIDGTGDRILALDVKDYSFTPDGRIIFYRGRPFPFFKYGIYIMNPDGTGKRRLVDCPGGAYSFYFFWSDEKRKGDRQEGDK